MLTRNFPGQLESLAEISQFVIQAARQAGLDDSQVYEVQLAVDEAATNIIEHAYRKVNNGVIECLCEILKNGLRVILIDQGDPFHPDDVPDPVFTTDVESVKPRGLGLYIMRKVMDEVRFDFTSGRGNTLTLVKYAKK